LRAILRRLSEDAGDSPLLYGLMQVLLAFDPADGDAAAFAGRLERLADGPDRQTALSASQWLCHLRENAGDAAGAIAAAKRTLALSRADDGPWRRRCRGPCWPSWPCTWATGRPRWSTPAPPCQ